MFHKIPVKETFLFKCEEPWHLTQNRWIAKGENVTLSYLMFKTCMTLYLVSTFAWSLVFRHLGWYVYGAKFWVYLTHWSYTTLVAWSVLDFAMVLQRFSSQLATPNKETPNDQLWWNSADHWRNRLLWFLTNLSHALAISVTVSYYTFEYPGSGLQLVQYSDLKSWELVNELFCTHNLHFIQSLWVLADTAFSSKPRRLFQFWPGLLFGIVYFTFQGLYIICGGTDPENQTWIYGAVKWKQNPGKSVGIAAASCLLTVMSHVLLWVLVKARDALWEKTGFVLKPKGPTRGASDRLIRSYPEPEEIIFISNL